MDIPNEKKQIDLASAYYTKGRKLWSKGDRDNALDLFRKALSIQESILGIYNKQTARTYYWVGYALSHRKEYSKALVAYRRTLRIRLFLLGEDDASTEDVKRALRDVLKEQGHDGAWIRNYMETIAAAVKHEKQAIVFEERGEYIEAVHEYESYLAIEEASIGNFPLDIARIHSKIADIHKTNHKEIMAISSYRRALSIFLSKLGPKHPDSQHCTNGIEACASIRGLKESEVEEYVDLVLESISLIREGDDLKTSGHIEKAIKKYEDALKIESITIGIYPLTAAQLHLEIAQCYRRLSQFDLAIVMLRTAISYFLIEHGEKHPAVVACFRAMTSILQEMGYSSADIDKYSNTISYSVKHERSGESLRRESDFIGAIAELQRSLELEVAALGKYHLTQVPLYKGIARAYDAQGQYAFASSSFRAALLICVTKLGLEHPTTQALFNETYETAKREGSECRTINDFVNLVTSSIQLEVSGSEQLEQGHYVKAYGTLNRAITAQEEAIGQYHICTSDLYSHAAKALLCSGQHDRALKKYRDLLVIQQSAFGRDHPSSQRALRGIGEALSAKRVKIEVANEYSSKVVNSVFHELTGDNEIKQALYNQAMFSYEQALRIEQSLLGTSYLTTAGLVDKIASTYRLRGQHHQAILTYRKSIQIYQAYDEPEHGDIQPTLRNLSLSMRSLGFSTAAAERYQRVIQASITHETQGDSALLAGNITKAISKYQMTIEIEEDVLGKLHPTISSFYKKIADISRNSEDFESAVLFYSKALAIEESYLGKDNASTVTTFNQLMNAAQKHGSKSGASLDGWNMLKYVLMGLIGLLVLIVSVAKSMSTNQRTIKSLKISAYDKFDDSDDDDPDDKKGFDPKRPLEPPEERYTIREASSNDSSSYETMSVTFDQMPSDIESLSASRRTVEKPATTKPSKTKQEKSRGSPVKENAPVIDSSTKFKMPPREDGQSTHIMTPVVEQTYDVEEILAMKPKTPVLQIGDVRGASIVETKAAVGNKDESFPTFTTRDKVDTTSITQAKYYEGKVTSPVTKEDGTLSDQEVKDMVGEIPTTNIPVIKESYVPESSLESDMEMEMKSKPALSEKVESKSERITKQSSLEEEGAEKPAVTPVKGEGQKASVSSTSDSPTWEKVVKPPIPPSENAKAPTIDDKVKSPKITMAKVVEQRTSLTKMLKKWRKAADNEGGDEKEEEEPTTGNENPFKMWKERAASTRNLGA